MLLHNKLINIFPGKEHYVKIEWGYVTLTAKIPARNVVNSIERNLNINEFIATVEGIIDEINLQGYEPSVRVFFNGKTITLLEGEEVIKTESWFINIYFSRNY